MTIVASYGIFACVCALILLWMAERAPLVDEHERPIDD